MHPEDVKAALRKRGTSLAQIARDLNIDRSTVSSVLKGVGRSRRVENAIAQGLGKPLAVVFPERYSSIVRDGVAS